MIKEPPDTSELDAAASLISGRPVDVDRVLDGLYGQPRWDRHLFYPVPRGGEFGKLDRFAGLPWNNIGHRLGNPPGGNHTKSAERAVLAWAARLFFGTAADGTWWGNLTSGGTGGNRGGLLAARDRFPTAAGGLTSAIAYYSDSDHYSIPKLLHELCIPAVRVRARPDGALDYDDLYDQLRPGAPAIVNITAGTTTTEAVTDPRRVAAVLDARGITDRHVHCDGALSSIPLALENQIDLSAVDSIATSGHKFLGVPQPTGFVVGRARSPRRERHIAYINTVDDSPAGSIDGLPALAMWLVIATLGEDGLRARAREARAVAAHLTERLNLIGVPAWRHSWAFTVVFPEPPASILRTWPVYRDQDGRCHLLCMPGVTREQVDTYVEALAVARRLETADLQRIPVQRTPRPASGFAVAPAPQAP
jgi:histidine decarboxylase